MEKYYISKITISLIFPLFSNNLSKNKINQQFFATINLDAKRGKLNSFKKIARKKVSRKM